MVGRGPFLLVVLDTFASRSQQFLIIRPDFVSVIEQGKVIALNFQVAMNPGLARALGTMLKQDFQRAVLNRMHTMSTDGELR
jgi:hypothetical protein